MGGPRTDIISLDKIDLDDLTFAVGGCEPDTALVESIRSMGLINPPVIFGNGKNFAVVSGRRRLRAAMECGTTEITATIIETSALDAMKTAASEHSRNRQLSAADIARLLKNSAGLGVKEEDIEREIMPALALKPSSSLREKFLWFSRFTELPGADVVAASVIKYLSRLDENGVKAVLELFDELNPGTNHQKEIVCLTEEIALCDEISAAEVIREAAEAADEKLPRARKIEAVRDALRRRRLPELSAKEEEFASIVSEIDTGGRGEVDWRHEPSFEDPDVTVTVSFRDRKKFEKVLQGLANAVSSGIIDKLLKCCRCEPGSDARERGGN